MSKPKFQYVSYDYTFLYKNNECGILPMAARVLAKTIGFDLADVQPMAEPVGVMPYMDYVYDSAVTYSPSDTTVSDSNVWYDIYQYEKIKRDRKANYFKKVNFYKSLNRKRYGKKV